MRKHVTTFIALAFLASGLLISTVPRAAENSPRPQGSMMGPGQMMGSQMSPGMMQGSQGGMGMMGMMNMMGQMNQMMATCNQMMQAMAQQHQGEPRKPGQAPDKNEG